MLLGARVYHPELKRWLVPDTVDPLRYTYTGGDPVNFIDPSGRMMLEIGKSEGPQQAIGNWDIGTMAGGLSSGIASYAAQVSGQIESAFNDGGELAALSVIAKADQAWVDSGGMESQTRAAVIGSWYSYFSAGAPIGYSRSETIPGPNNSAAVAFSPERGSGLAPFTAFRGTEGSSVANWATNAQNYAGLPTKAHEWAAQVGRDFKKDNPNGFFAGHSLGGGLAAMAAMATGMPAITINAAGVSDANLKRAGWANPGAARAAGNRFITNHVIVGEILSTAQFVSPGDRAALGSPTYYLSQELFSLSSIELHTISVAARIIQRSSP